MHFWPRLQKRIDPKKFGSTREQNLLESLKNYGKLKEYKVTLHWVRPRLHLLKAQYDHWKLYFTAYKKDNGCKYIHKLTQFVTTLISRWNSSIDLIPKNCLKNPIFCPFCTADQYESLQTPGLELETEFASRSMIYHSRTVVNDSVQKTFSMLLHFLSKNLQHAQ